MINSIKIKNLKFRSFRSFKDKQELSNLPSNGLILINGINTNTGGSSGSGKSNLHLAISYALDFCPYPATELQSWLTEDPMQVELELETNLGEVLIKRGETNSFSSEFKQASGAKATSTAVRELFGIPINLVEALTFRQQKTPGRFLSITDSGKKDFLSELLGLQEIETNIDNSVKKTNELKKEIDKYEAIVFSLNEQLHEPNPPIPLCVDEVKYKDLQNKIAEEQENLSKYVESLKILQEKLNEVKESKAPPVKLENNNGELDDLLSKCDELIDKQEKEKTKFLSDLRSELEYEEKSLLSCNKEYSKITFIEEKLKQLNEKLQAVFNKECPTCKQSWLADGTVIPDTESEIKNFELFKAASLKAKELANNHSLRINSLKYDIDNYKNQELEDLIKTRNSLKTKISTLLLEQEKNSLRHLNEFNYKKQKEIEKIENEASPVIRQYNDKKELISNLQSQLKEEGLIIRKNREINSTLAKQYEEEFHRYNNSISKIVENEVKLKYYKDNYNLEMDLSSLLKSFLGVIFEEVLDEIADETNRRLKLLPNVETTTISFSTETLTQKGTVKQEIKPVILKNGLEIPLKSGLSGGQLTSVELAVDLAVSNVIARRTGFNPGWLILDESFDGHDVPVKEACLELLKEESKDKLIFVIDHSTEVKEYFDECILVENIDDVSYVKRN